MGGDRIKSLEWLTRIGNRNDMSISLVHLTKENEINGKEFTALDILIKIIEEGVIYGSTTESGFICGNTPAVCFQETPLYSLAQNIYYENRLRKENKTKKVRYQGYGLRFYKDLIYRSGGRPVIYDRTSDAKRYLKESQWWRIVNLEINDCKNIIDWTHEREWRIPGDFKFEKSDVSIIITGEKNRNKLIDHFKIKDIDIDKEVRSIINIEDILF